MDNNPLWVIETKQMNPSDFYIRVDGSKYYTAFWVARAADQEHVKLLLERVVLELDLGDTEIVGISLYSNLQIERADILADLNEFVNDFGLGEKINLAVWVSSNGDIL